MFAFWTSRITLKGLYFLAMGKAYFRFRNPRRQASGRNQDAFYRKAWREAIESLGGSFRELGPRFSELTLGDVRTRVVENVSGIDDPVTLGIMHDKVLTHEILKGVGVPTPRHAAFTFKDLRPALAFLQKKNGRDCVVKPAGGTGGGRGVTTGIRRRSHLARAAAAAAVYNDELLIEEQLEGENYRLLYLDGELIDAFVRRPPSVIGDGRSTVAALVHAANDDRLKQGFGVSQVLLAVDLDMKRTLAKQGLSLSAVPSASTRVILKTVINENSGADNSTAVDSLCPSIVDDCRRAVVALGSRFAGVDLITTNPGVPLAESGGAIIEVNGTPNLYFHYHKKDGCFPVAVPLLRRLMVDRQVPADTDDKTRFAVISALSAVDSNPNELLETAQT
jgi:cyanophycin synthetase